MYKQLTAKKLAFRDCNYGCYWTITMLDYSLIKNSLKCNYELNHVQYYVWVILYAVQFSCKVTKACDLHASHSQFTCESFAVCTSVTHDLPVRSVTYVSLLSYRRDLHIKPFKLPNVGFPVVCDMSAALAEFRAKLA